MRAGPGRRAAGTTAVAAAVLAVLVAGSLPAAATHPAP